MNKDEEAVELIVSDNKITPCVKMMTLAEQFTHFNRAICERCFTDPNVLKKEAKDFPLIVSKLQEQANKEKQGLGNKETDHEVCFAVLLEEHGFKFLLKKKKGDHMKLLKTLVDGMYYIYQVNGSQQSLDFQTILVENKSITKTFTYDLKHTTTDSFYLNDGWFLDNIIYIITWASAKVNKTLIALGQNIPTTEEKERYAKILEMKKLLNAGKDDNKSSLMVVHRFANRYKCAKFTSEWSKARFEEVVAFL